MTRPTAHVTPLPGDSTGLLTWEPSGAGDALVADLRTAVESGFAAGLRRIQAEVDPDDRQSRRALHRVGFRLEGRLRRAADGPNGRRDVLLYALLDDDPVGGAEGFTAVMNTVTPRKRLIAHALVTDPLMRVLLCETSFKSDWELPGGIVEPGESPRTGCAREITEELGLTLEVGRVLAIDWMHPHLGWEDAVEMIFDTAPLSTTDVAALRVDGREIVAAHWLTLPEACERVAPYSAPRLRAAWTARFGATTAYLEDGQLPD